MPLAGHIEGILQMLSWAASAGPGCIGVSHGGVPRSRAISANHFRLGMHEDSPPANVSAVEAAASQEIVRDMVQH